MSSESGTTLVLGIGNPLRGDDGFGPIVIEWLREHDLPPGVVAQDEGTPGLDLVMLWTNYRRVIIVDAADIGRAPGDWSRIVPNIDRLKQIASSNDSVTLHQAGLSDALKLSAALGTLPDELIILGIQPARLDWSSGLSAELQAAVSTVGGAVLREIGG